MKRFLRSHRSLSTIEPARPHRPAHMSALSLKVNVRPPSSQTVSPKENTQSDPPQVSPHQYHSFHVTRIHLKSSPRSSVRQQTIHLSLISRVQRLLAPRLSQMAQQMFIIEGSSGLFSLLFLSLIVTHSLHTAHTWLVGIKTLFSSGA